MTQRNTPPFRADHVGSLLRTPALKAVRERRAIVLNEVDADSPVDREAADREPRARSVAAFPLLVDSEPVGALDLHCAEAGYFDLSEMRLLLELAGDVSFALKHIQRAEQLEYLALFDSMTGLANRTLFLDRLGQRLRLAEQTNEPVAVVLADIERLTSVNASFGRHAGDAILTMAEYQLA